jgi:hypothetical protein
VGFPEDIRNGLLDGLINGTLYIALFTVAPDNNGTGGTEVSAAGYARLGFNQWGDAVNGVKRNNADAIWPDAAYSYWGTVVCVGLYDAVSGGNFIARGDNTLAKTIGIGIIPRLLTGEIEFMINNEVD